MATPVRWSGSRASREVDAGTRRVEITEAVPNNLMRGLALAKVFALERSRPLILHLRKRENAIRNVFKIVFNSFFIVIYFSFDAIHIIIVFNK